jgi:hypothetical protein
VVQSRFGPPKRQSLTSKILELVGFRKRHRRRASKGSPSLGRPVSSRQKISERLLQDLASVWEEHGRTVLERFAKDDPAKLAQIAYGLLPRDVFVKVEDQRTPGGFDADSYAVLRRLLDVIERCGAIGEPQRVFEMIEEDLRARMAVPVEGK